MAKESKPVAVEDDSILVRVIRNGLTADVTKTSLPGWIADGWKQVDAKAEKAGA
jgi:hypothetical protein